MERRNEDTRAAQIRQGIILAGGRSLRMGTDKAMLDLGGQPLLLRIIGQMRAAGIHSLILAVRDGEQEKRYLSALRERLQVGNIRIVSGAGLQAAPSFTDPALLAEDIAGRDWPESVSGPEELGISFTQDSYPECGPLAGLHAALSAAPEEGYAFVMACDMPVLSIPLLLRMAAAAQANQPVDAILTAGQPFHALYHTDAARVIQQQLERGDFRVMHMLERLRSVTVSLTEEEAAAYVNLNTPEIYRQFLSGD
ncbi:molybdenum cofactor guanylyltransferase [Paenibacillus nasutitermitis]|uniref:Probable molybdenum cofactor guanylyltransferase n=1 Tax=Paenibacillus nasutitermitis TaxID=1652958 RepID=A0A916ZFL8_9BACL|nr:molybdenum cofactor guanylyltransferase [Paenibacillus nasutitermitis]GGD93024.1 molybdenum cofactor guanylyltransferase [Paenibacillus nasutitermitis]